jgi:putative nucleotidyltransferase with HDIG domain
MTGDAAALTRALLVAIRQVRHYGGGHPAALQALRGFDALARTRAGTDVRWDASPEWLIAQDVLLPADDAQAAALRDHLIARRIGRLVVTSRASEADVRAAVALLAREPEELVAEGGAAEALRAAGVEGVEVEEWAARAPAPAEPEDYLAALAAVDRLVAAAERGGRIDLAGAGLIAEGLLPGDEPKARALWAQVAVRGHDELDPAHAVNTAFLAMQLAGALGFSRAERIEIGRAALLHDIGMARLPWEQRLAERTPRVREAAPRHAIEGARVLRHLGGSESVPMLVALEHHRPGRGPAGDVAPPSAIVALADYVDAMTCGRAPGLRAAAPGDLLDALLAGEGSGFDPLQVRLLAHLLRAAGWGDAVI